MNKYLESIIIFILIFSIIKLIGKIFNKLNKKKLIHIVFLKSILQVIVIIVGIFLIGYKYETFRNISSSIITGSTLIVAVLAFSLEEGIANIIHGLVISISKPFNIGDRLTLPDKKITGTVESITIRHTVIKNIVTGAYILVPNSIINKEIIENSHYSQTTYTYFVDISISRDSDIEKAINIFKQVIFESKYFSGNMTDISIYINEISETALYLRGFVKTNSVEDNFIACSEIRKNLLIKFQENNISFPYSVYESKNLS